MPLHYGSARELLEAARDALVDYDACAGHFEKLRIRAESLGGSGFAAVRGPSPHDVLESRVVTLADVGKAYATRMDADERIIRLACAMLYGPEYEDGVLGGLMALVPSRSKWWVDALYDHYLLSWSWSKIGERLKYSPSHVRSSAYAALEIADAHGLAATIAGEGFAEG